ncbi:MAG TPA: non-reducing end alpha-L-arabinofuranosidase family hydrolase [Polyangiaceae bacterium]|nr:non-reducing end alpha-L-arabinofuranosidase family hydrolase [Polyangiaceae bacterium]
MLLNERFARPIAAVLLVISSACASQRAEGAAAAGGANAGGGNVSSGGAGGTAGADYDVTLGTGARCGESASPPELEGAAISSSFRWCSSGPLVSAVRTDDHPILSVKDPSVVYYGDRFHIFATTADANQQWSLVYLNFADWKDAPSAKLHYLNENPALTGYHAAPQIFFFAPQNKWYLIFQSGQPQYTTSDDLSDPDSWVRPTNFFSGVPSIVDKSSGGWLDFWNICDELNCYLFFADDAGQFYRSQTKLEDFPNGFGDPVIAIQGTKETVFEGGAVYRIAGTSRYLAMIEAFGPDGHRFYRSYTADTLDGEWAPFADTWENPLAASTNVTFASGVAWTRDFSHGELLRSGYDQTPTVSLTDLKFLYQGVSRGTPQYYQLPYQLALLTRMY